MTSILLDDRAEPPLRSILGALLARATTADFAISRMRLDGLDLVGGELGRIRRCRVLLGRLDAQTLEDMMGGHDRGPAQRHHLHALRDFLASGRVEVRAAGIVSWNPDFSILEGLQDAPAHSIALVGAHYFLRPYQIDGAAFTTMISDPEPVSRLHVRFEELWNLGYDVGEVVRATLEHLDAELAETRSPPAWHERII